MNSAVPFTTRALRPSILADCIDFRERYIKLFQSTKASRFQSPSRQHNTTSTGQDKTRQAQAEDMIRHTHTLNLFLTHWKWALSWLNSSAGASAETVPIMREAALGLFRKSGIAEVRCCSHHGSFHLFFLQHVLLYDISNFKRIKCECCEFMFRLVTD